MMIGQRKSRLDSSFLHSCLFHQEADKTDASSSENVTPARTSQPLKSLAF